MQLDDSIHTAGLSVSQVFVGYMHKNQVDKQMLMCKSLPEHGIDSYMTDKG
jgi:hypothetical protein